MHNKKKDKLIEELTSNLKITNEKYEKLQNSFDTLQDSFDQLNSWISGLHKPEIQTNKNENELVSNTPKRKIQISMNNGKRAKLNSNNNINESMVTDEHEEATTPPERTDNVAVDNNNTPDGIAPADVSTVTENTNKDNVEAITETTRPILSFADVLSKATSFDSGELLRKNDDENKIKINRNVTPIEININNNEQRASLHSLILNNVDINCFTITNTRSTIKVNPTDEATRNRVMLVLESNDVPFVTFTPRDKQMRAFIMRGLPHDSIDTDSLREIFSENGFKVTKVEEFSTGFTRTNNISTNLWKIVCSNDTELDELQKIKFICNVSVRFETMKRKGAIQCRKCQGFMHTAANCHRGFKCVKCGKSHEIGNCKVKDEKKLRCANCGKNHSANNLTECEFFQNEILPLSKKNKIRQIEKPKNPPEPRKEKNKKNPQQKAKEHNKKTMSGKPNQRNSNELYNELNQIEKRITDKILQLINNKLSNTIGPNGLQNKKKSKTRRGRYGR